MKLRAYSRHLFHIGVRVGITFNLAISADASAGSFDGLVSSFGNLTEEAEKTERQMVMPVDDQSPEPIAEQNLAALAAQNSFPIRITKDVGIHEAWTGMPKEAVEPKKLSKSYKVGACQFALQTSAYSVRTYEEGNPGSYQIAEDSVIAHKTFSLGENQALNVSVATSVVAKTEDQSESACRKLFKGRRVPIGRATLSESELLAMKGSQSAIKATLATEGNGTLLFVTWDEDQQTLTVVDEFDMAPSLETGVMALASLPAKGVYYLSLRAKWSIEKNAKRSH